METYRKNSNFVNKKCLLLGVVIAIMLDGKSYADKRVTTTTGNVLERSVVKIPSNLQVPEQWKALLNPQTDDFWNEGNFKPDQGFVIWAKNPTIENAKLYLIRMNAKRDRLHIMQQQQDQANKELIKLGVIANDYDFLAGVARS